MCRFDVNVSGLLHDYRKMTYPMCVVAVLLRYYVKITVKFNMDAGQ